ncbi:uncharacterized protein LOC134657945 [Cydia amplana]|uniref:uncharacterized protein LOC134657945 n=1 Tax=Cydia amplana TaxID=1869771 RepID=UPI002FE556B7
MNENTVDPTCSCGNVGKSLPGVIKCECDSSDNEEAARDGKENIQEEFVDEDSIKDKERKKHQDSRKIRAVRNKLDDYIQMARFSNDDRDSYWTDDDRCGCQIQRSADDDDNLTLRCGCNGPKYFERVGEDDRDDGYWSDDSYCGCKLLRNTDDDRDITHNLRCRCNSPARVVKDDTREVGWTDDYRCGCKQLRNKDDDDDITHNLRCRCNSPARAGKNDDRDDGYWSDDSYCGCSLLRNTDNDDDMTHNLRCRCNSPARIGDDDRDVGYWSDDSYCECNLLRNHGNGVKDLRCRCNSPSRSGRDIFSAPRLKQRTELFSSILSDLSDEDNDQSINSKTSSDEHSLSTLMSFILDKDDDVDLSQLPKVQRQVIIKLKNIIPSLRNIDISELKDNIESMLYKNELSLREFRQKSDSENDLTAKQIQSLLKVIEQQRAPAKKSERLLELIGAGKTPAKYNSKLYRRNMPDDSIGVPFTYELHGLAQINA